MIKLLIGGSPCTHWSIAQTKNRETAPEGIGWELFLNYLIARNKYAPDYFLYENNKSMSPSVREKITELLGVRPTLINSALVRSIAGLPLRRVQRTFANIPELSTSGGISSSTIFSATETSRSIPRSRRRTRSIRA